MLLPQVAWPLVVLLRRTPNLQEIALPVRSLLSFKYLSSRMYFSPPELQLDSMSLGEYYLIQSNDDAVQAWMQDMGLSGNYTMVDAYAEMLITHGVDSKSNAPSCSSCHDGSGQTPDNTKMLPFTALGYHEFPSENMCSFCHGSKSMDWQSMHSKHVETIGFDCSSCHTAPPTGLTSSSSSLCASCHGYKSESDPRKIDEKHVKKKISCSTCHNF